MLANVHGDGLRVGFSVIQKFANGGLVLGKHVEK